VVSRPSSIEQSPQRCELCGEERAQGKRHVAIPGEAPMWICDDCERMLLLRVDDKGTPGD